MPPCERQDALLLVVALRRDLDDLPGRVRGRRAHRRPHRRSRRRAGRKRRVGAARRVSEDDVDPVERQPELLGGDLGHRRRRPGPDVLHRRHDRRAPVRAEAHPRVGGRAPAAVPDLAREPDAVLPRAGAARPHLVAPLPVRLGALVALHQVLRRVRLVVVRVRVVQLPKLERIHLQLRRELVEDALEPERALDEAGRAEGLHRRRVQLGRREHGADVLAVVEHPHRPVRRRRPAVPPGCVHVLAGQRDERPVRARCRGQALDRRVPVAGREVLLAAGERAAHGTSRPPGELGGHEGVVVRAVLRAEAAAHELADDAHLVGRETELRRNLVAHAPDELGRDVDVETIAAPLANGLMCLERAVEHCLRPELGLDDEVGLRDRLVHVAALVPARLAHELAAAYRLVGIEQRLANVPVDLDEVERGARLAVGLGGDRRDRAAPGSPARR